MNLKEGKITLLEITVVKQALISTQGIKLSKSL